MTRTRQELEAAVAAGKEAEALLATMPVDPLLIEAREICAAIWGEEDRHNFEAFYREGVSPENRYMRTALAALRRGMELAKPELTREQLSDAIVKVFGEGERGFAGVTPNNITALHAALTEGQSK